MLDNSVSFQTVAEHAENVEPCCAHCKTEMDDAPWRAALIREQCLFGTRVSIDQTNGALTWG